MSLVPKTGLCKFATKLFRFNADCLVSRMPVEHLRLKFKPNSFFKVNPSMDVPGIKDLHSVPAFPNGAGGPNGINGQSCCSD
jgi:hypothetical protein